MKKGVDDDVHVVVVLYVVQANVSRDVRFMAEVEGLLGEYGWTGKGFDTLWSERWCQHECYVLQRGIGDGVSVWKYVDLA